jgi:hypothetical protein
MNHRNLSEAYSSIVKSQHSNVLENGDASEVMFKDYFSVPGRAEAALQQIKWGFDYYKKNSNATSLQIFLDNLDTYLAPKKDL